MGGEWRELARSETATHQHVPATVRPLSGTARNLRGCFSGLHPKSVWTRTQDASSRRSRRPTAARMLPHSPRALHMGDGGARDGEPLW